MIYGIWPTCYQGKGSDKALGTSELCDRTDSAFFRSLSGTCRASGRERLLPRWVREILKEHFPGRQVDENKSPVRSARCIQINFAKLCNMIYLQKKTCTHKNTCIFSSTCGNFWYHSCVLDFVVHFSPLLILHLQIVAFRLMNSAGCIWTDLTSSTSSTCPSLKKNTPQHLKSDLIRSQLTSPGTDVIDMPSCRKSSVRL